MGIDILIERKHIILFLGSRKCVAFDVTDVSITEKATFFIFVYDIVTKKYYNVQNILISLANKCNIEDVTKHFTET